MQILLTRNKNDNECTRRELMDKLSQSQLFGHDTKVSTINLLDLSEIYFDFSRLVAYNNIILTSKYAVSIIGNNLDRISNSGNEMIRLWIVGKVSARILQDKIDVFNNSFSSTDYRLSDSQRGYFKIEYVANSAKELIAVLSNRHGLFMTKQASDRKMLENFGAQVQLAQSCDVLNIDEEHTRQSISRDSIRSTFNASKAVKQSYAYLSGNIITMEMPSFVDRYEIYSSAYKSVLTLDDMITLKRKIDLIVVYSENCAKTLITLLEASNLTKYVANSMVLAISSKVARPLGDAFRDIVIAKDPSMVTEAILEICQKRITK